MLRGINYQTIFLDDEDCEKYLHCLAECKKVSGFHLYAFCLMGNHVHLLIEEGKEPLAQIFKRLGARYVFWYNWKYARSGHLFQDRYRSEPVDNDRYFLAVLRYIYQNPVKAGLCKSTGDYPWSSYRNTGIGAALISDEKALGLLAPNELERFINEPATEICLDIREKARLTDQSAVVLMKRLCKADSVAEFQRLGQAEQLTGIRKLYKNACSIRQIARITGVSKGIVEKILKDG